MADNNKVTIDAAWFAELYAKANERNEIENKLEDTMVECDELKAKLAEHADLLQRTEAERVALKAKLAAAEKSVESLDAAFCNDERLAAAERCIEEVSKWIGEPNWIVDSRASRVIREIIRAYREQKEAAR